jgi:hypothetical protein
MDSAGGVWFRLRGASFASVRSYLYHAVVTKVIVELDIDRIRRGERSDVLRSEGQEEEYVISGEWI